MTDQEFIEQTAEMLSTFDDIGVEWCRRFLEDCQIRCIDDLVDHCQDPARPTMDYKDMLCELAPQLLDHPFDPDA